MSVIVIVIIIGSVIGGLLFCAACCYVGLNLFRLDRDKALPLRKYEPPKPPPTPPRPPTPRRKAKYHIREKKKKKEYKSRHETEIESDSESDEDDEEHIVHIERKNKGFFSCIFPCIYNFEQRPHHNTIIPEGISNNNNLFSTIGHDEITENPEIVDVETGLRPSEILNEAEAKGRERKNRTEMTDEEKAAVAARKEKQAKRARKVQPKIEFVEKKQVVIDPLARYNITFPAFGRLRGLPMSLDFMNSSHAKRAYEIVVGRKVNRLKKKKDFVLSGGVDDVALNSGPDAHLIPAGFVVSPTIPELSYAFNGEIVMILWDFDMNDGLGDPVIGWFRAKVHSFCKRPPYNFILKYAKEVTNNRKLDGFVNTILAEAGVHGYMRRWVWLRHEFARSREDKQSRGSGEEPLSKEEQEQLDALTQEYAELDERGDEDDDAEDE